MVAQNGAFPPHRGPASPQDSPGHGRLARGVRPSRGLRAACAGCGFGLWPGARGLEQQWIPSAMGALVASEEGNRRAWHQDSLMMLLPFAELIGHQTGVNVQTRRSRAASGRSCLCGCQSCRQELPPPPSGFPSSLLPPQRSAGARPALG